MSSNYCILLAGDREELSRGGRLHGREERLLRRQPQGRRPAELLPRRNPQGTELTGLIGYHCDCHGTMTKYVVPKSDEHILDNRSRSPSKLVCSVLSGIIQK